MGSPLICPLFHFKWRQPIRKKQGSCPWATRWQRSVLPIGIFPCKLVCPLLTYMETVGSSVGSPLLLNMKKWAADWAAHGNFAMQIRLPTTIYGDGGQLSMQQNGLPTGIFPCKLGCPLLPYMGTMGSGVGCLWELCHTNEAAHYFHIWRQLAAHRKFAMQIRLPTTSIYGYSGQLCGQPTTFQYGNSWRLSG